MTLNDLEIRSTVNPQKYSSLKDRVSLLDKKFNILNERLSKINGYDEKLHSLVNDYFTSIDNNFDISRESREIVLNHRKKMMNILNIDSRFSREMKNLLALNFKTIQAITIKNIIEQSTKYDFKFNKLCANVIAEKNIIFEGETFAANIVLTAIDTTKMPITIINGDTIPINKYGEAIVTFKAGKKGMHYFNGEMKYTAGNTGRMLSFPFEYSYVVK